MRFFAKTTRARLLAGAASGTLLLCAGAAMAQEDARINIAPQSLTSALYEFGVQTDRQVMFAPGLTGSKTTTGVVAADEKLALAQLLKGTGLSYRVEGDVFIIVEGEGGSDPQSAGAAGDGAEGTVDALIVTAQKREEDIQDVPIAISAFTQETLERSQVAGGPDLMTQVPNMTFTKTNFTSYSIQIRGIGTQAISATTDAAVAVAFNNSSMIRNRFFEQEFYDLARVEVLRGPQGTLYGRNATAGVVNIITAKPSFGYEAKLSADVANYSSLRLEGMANIPLVDDAAALRIAGAWTKREGYVTNELTGEQIDGRDLWSARASLRIEPAEWWSANFIYEHFEEDDDRLRSGKQLCKKHIPDPINGLPVPEDGGLSGSAASMFSLGCAATSMYSPEAFQTPYGYALPYYGPLAQIGLAVHPDVDPYASQTQSRDLRVIESTREPEYRAQSDVAQVQLGFDVAGDLTITSETAYSVDTLFSTQDFNRFNTKPGAFGIHAEAVDDNGVFCDPQLGCSNRLVLADLSTAESRQFSQEVRLSSNYEGDFDFSLGFNFLRYDTEDKYYVFINSLTLWATMSWADPGGPYIPNVSDNSGCMKRQNRPGDPTVTAGVTGCIPIDPNPIESLNDSGHNYFLSKNPYRLISYAVFGEAYYNLAPELRLTAGLRWTVDKKHAPLIPSWLIAANTAGYPVMEVIDQEWREPTGRFAIDWRPHLGITDETLVYASYAHGYKAGGVNPPPPVIATYGNSPELQDSVIHPKTFDAEYIDAFEIGAKNTALDGRLTINFSGFYYDYQGYQISQIIDRSAINSNFDVRVWGAEVEADWRPVENLKLGLKGGYQNTRMADGSRAIDIRDRTAGDPEWVTMRPFPSVPSNCIMPVWWVTYGGQLNLPWTANGGPGPCVLSYIHRVDPLTWATYVPDPTHDRFGTPLGGIWEDYPGFDPSTAPNNGEGIFKDLSGNELPNAPNFTATITADYTVPLPADWLMTLHTDLYYQSEAWTRIFNTEGYDKLKAYTNVNLAAIFTNDDDGWKVMAYVKNVFDRDSITGAFLNSDDTGLTTNVFLTEPRLYGLRVTKEWRSLPWSVGGRSPDGSYPISVEFGGGLLSTEARNEVYAPDFTDSFTSPGLPFPLEEQQKDLDWGDTRELKVAFDPDGPWKLSAGLRHGRSNGSGGAFAEEQAPGGYTFGSAKYAEGEVNYVRTTVSHQEKHMLVDFMVGREVGLGGRIKSTVDVGVRYANLEASSAMLLVGIPNYYMAPENAWFEPMTHDFHTARFDARRSFEGVGPAIAWDASREIVGNDEAGHLDLDWQVSAGVLFGRQDTDAHQMIASEHTSWIVLGYDAGRTVTTNIDAPSSLRSRSATVPTLGGAVGLSYRLDRLQISVGYRYDRFFDVIDGGVDAPKDADRAIQGPFLRFKLGFGG